MVRRRDLLDEIEAAAEGPSGDLPKALRRCLTLGGLTESAPLREWASLELKGYEDDEKLPGYRGAPSLLMGNTVMAKGQVVPAEFVPDDIRELVDDEPKLRSPLGELIAMHQGAVRSGEDHLKIVPPGMSMLLALINNEVRRHGNAPGLQFERVYYMVPITTLERVIDCVRTTLVELVAEMRAARPGPGLLATGEAADRAVSVAVRGIGHRVTVHQAVGDGASVSSMVPTSVTSPWVLRWAAIGALATLAGAVVAIVI